MSIARKLLGAEGGITPEHQVARSVRFVFQVAENEIRASGNQFDQQPSIRTLPWCRLENSDRAGKEILPRRALLERFHHLIQGGPGLEATDAHLVLDLPLIRECEDNGAGVNLFRQRLKGIVVRNHVDFPHPLGELGASRPAENHGQDEYGERSERFQNRHRLLLKQSGVRNAKMANRAFPGKLTGSNPSTPAVMAEKHGPWLARDRCGSE